MAQTVTVTKTGSPEQEGPKNQLESTYFRLANDAGNPRNTLACIGND